MSTKEWKNKELMENLSEKFGFKMKLKALNESKEKDENEKSVNEEDENKKPDEDGDGVPDYADKKPGEDDNKESGDKKDSKDGKEKSGKDLSKVPPQLRKHVAKKKQNESRIMKIIKQEIRKQLKERK